MSRPMKCVIVQFIAWTIVALFLIVLYFQSGTISHWEANELKTLLQTIFLFVGFGTDGIVYFISKSKKFGFKKDERDQNISVKAIATSYASSILIIYLTAIILYTVYEGQGVVPVAWLWIIAYCSVVSTRVTYTLASLVLYIKQGY